MALIGNLRSKMGTWVVVFVFVAIIAFILGDLLGSNSMFLNDDEIGEIAGHSISLKEYQQVVQEREANYYLNFGRQPAEREMITLRQQAWELLILRYAIQKQFDKVGVEVTSAEQEDMIWGKNVDPNVKQAFTNPQTGQFDKDRLLSYLKEISNPPTDPQMQGMWQEQRTRWEVFQKDLAPGRQRVKYENLLVKTNYITKAEAEREYHMQSDVAEIKYVYVPFYAVTDSLAEVTDSDLKDYYNSHKERYKTENTRDLKYVTFSLLASSQDTLEIKNEMQRMAEELAKTEEDSAFAMSNSDSKEAFVKFNASSVPPSVKQEDLVKGNVIGPFIDGNVFKVIKVSDVTEDTVYSARASHILIKWDSETEEDKKTAKEKARNILKEIKGGASFAEKAREHGTDGTASSGGDLGWFSTGRMVKPFEDAVFKATKPGVLNDVVETQFGYHIISVTNPKENTAYKLSVIERQISPGDATTNEAYRKAEAFAADLSNEEEFVEQAKKENLPVLEGKNVTASERRVGTLGEARQIVQWLFRDAKKGKISEVFDLQDQYVVAVMTGEIEEGYKPLEVVKDEITPEVRKQVKGKTIVEKLKSASGSLEDIAKAYGADANVYTSNDVKLNSTSLPTAGFEPVAIGTAFSLENGKRTEPFAGENGVLIIELQNKTIAPAIADYTAYRAPLEQNSQNRSSYSIAEAIKENAKIEDKRYKFY
jgi:peptidyl-prolyl cis-trans isomerase D